MQTTLSALTLSASIAISAILCSTTVAQAQPQCGMRSSILEVLDRQYGETPVAIGVTQGGGLLEVISSADGVTWSILVTTPEGMSCLVAAGEGWRAGIETISGPDA